MTWLLLAGGLAGAWAVLSVLCGERHRRVQEAEIRALFRRQSAERAALEASRRSALQAAAKDASAHSPQSSQTSN